ncbi:MAG: hypothetical protein HY321_09910 [Armatimonadetes bacterium]|nr:hypothetical protein [Armatimonadota bacterium]
MSLDRPLPQLRPPVVLAMLIVALALQTTVLSAAAIGGIKPDLVLVVALCTGLLSGPAPGAACGAAAGLMEGYLQGTHLGALGATRALAAFAVGMVETRLVQDRVVIPSVMVLLGSLAAHGLYFIMAPEFPVGRPVRIAVTESLLNMVFTPLVHLSLARWGLAKRR